MFKNRNTIYFAFFLFIIIFPLVLTTPSKASDTTAPTTNITLDGALGNNGWYISTVGIHLQAVDLESGPKSTTYWLNSDSPTTNNYSTSANAIQNPSFEDGFLWWASNWGDSGGALFYRSLFVSKFGWRSASILSAVNNGYYYWHNRDYYVPTTAGQNYTVTAWAKTLDLFAQRGAWFEVWARKASGSTDVLVASSDKIWGTQDWILLSKSFTSPADYDGIYLRLGMEDSGGIGFAWWDGVTLNTQLETSTDFVIVQNGNHTAHYYSTDISNNNESTQNTPVKIDTNAPGTWNDFLAPGCGNDHSYDASVNAIDPISGINASSAQYRYYTNHQGIGWSNWTNVQSVTLISNGQPAPNGTTAEVILNTPCIDFGDSSTVYRVQFKISDMAGNESNSPIYTIEGPWVQSGSGEIYAQNGISMIASPPSGTDNATDTIIIGNETVDSFSTSAARTVLNYDYPGNNFITDHIPTYSLLQDTALPLPQNNLPITSGVYIFNGNYTIDNNTATNGFKNNPLSAIIIVNGNLRIKNSYTINQNSGVIFLVSGNIEIEGGVETAQGVFIGNGYFDSNIDNKINPKQLVISGSIVVNGDILLSRDLGRKGNPDNSDTPAEYISLPATYYLNEQLATLLNFSTIETWGESF